MCDIVKQPGLRLAAFLLAALLLLPAIFLAAAAPEFTTGKNLPDAIQGVYYSARIKASGENPLLIPSPLGITLPTAFPRG